LNFDKEMVDNDPDENPTLTKENPPAEHADEWNSEPEEKDFHELKDDS